MIREGARLAEPGEFTCGPFWTVGSIYQPEAVMDIIRAKTDKAMNIAVKQPDGSLSDLDQQHAPRDPQYLGSRSVNIDHPEYDDVEEANHWDHPVKRPSEFEALLTNLPKTARRGKILREGDFYRYHRVSPNVGKSSLLNNLLREEKPSWPISKEPPVMLSREYVNINGVPLKLVDTAGIRETEDIVEQIGVERSKKPSKEADLVLLVLNASEPLTDQDRQPWNLSR